MTTEVSLIRTMAERYNMDPRKFQRVVFDTCMPTDKVDVTEEQFALFMVRAHQLNLNPLAREIYAAPAKKGKGIMIIVGVDGWLEIANRQPQMDGMDFDYQWDGPKLISVTCRIYRKDRSRPIAVAEYLRECWQDTDAWKTRPVRMLRHKAVMQAIRYAFSVSGVMDPDEYDAMEHGGRDASRNNYSGNGFDAQLPVVPAAPRPSPRSSVASTAPGAAEPLAEAASGEGGQPQQSVPPPPVSHDDDGVIDDLDPEPITAAGIDDWRHRLKSSEAKICEEIFATEIEPALEQGRISRITREELIEIVIKRGAEGWR